MMPQILPILGSVAVYPCAVPIPVAQGDFTASHALRGSSRPTHVLVRRITPGVGIDYRPSGIEEEDLVPCIAEPQHPAVHPSDVARFEREVGDGERVFRVARCVPRDQEATVRGQDGIRREDGRRLAIREGPRGHVEWYRAPVADLHELVVAGRVRVDADEEDASVGFSGKKGGRGPGTRGEGFGVGRRRGGRGGQGEGRGGDGGRGREDPHAGRATPAAIRRPATRTLLRGGIAGPRES